MIINKLLSVFCALAFYAALQLSNFYIPTPPPRVQCPLAIREVETDNPNTKQYIIYCANMMEF